MKVLGIGSDIWLSSAALVIDGEIDAASTEERFNRQKMSNAFPAKAIDYCLSTVGCTIDEIDHVAFAWNPGPHLRSASGRFTASPQWRGEYLSTIPASLLRHFGSPNVTDIRQEINSENWAVDIHYVDHHATHAACAYFLSPFKNAAVLTIDGRGEIDTTTLNIAKNGKISALSSTQMPHSLGLFYGMFTDYLGFRPDSDEWKVMALSSYGSHDPKIVDKVRSLITLLLDGGFEVDPTYTSYYHFDRQPHMYTQKLTDLLGPARKKDAEFEPRHSQIAFALQFVFEETMVHLLNELHRMTGLLRVA